MCTYKTKEKSSQFKNNVSLNVQKNGETFRFRKLRSNANSFQTINTLSVSSPCTHQTSQIVRDNVSVIKNLYNNVSTVLNKLKNKLLLFLTWNWNAKVGKKIKEHASDNCIGSFVPGVRNNNGQHLVNFCAIQILNALSGSSTYPHQLASLAETMFL